LKFVFHTTKFEPTDRPHVYHIVTLVRYARTVEQALELALPAVPEGHRIWSWWEDRQGCCLLCGGPWHPATGHLSKEGWHWCGACTRGMIKFLKSMLVRRWGGIRFYEHATVPQGDTSAQDLSED
jgi:hypothetical protein